MDTQQLYYVADDVKIRKKWLISFLILLIVPIFGLIVRLFFEPDTLAFVIGSAQIAVWSLITYNRAYKERGTAWLMFTLIVIPLQIVILYIISYMDGSVEELVVNAVFVTPLMIYFWINCLRLRKYNKMYKAEFSIKHSM